MSSAARPRPRRIEPGLDHRPPGTERRLVRGGCVAALSLAAGDRVTLVDLEGGQACALRAVGPERRDRLAPLSVTDLDGCSLADLEQRGIVLDGPPLARLSGSGTRPCEQTTCIVPSATIGVVTVPGRPMAVDGSDPPTDVLVLVERADARAPDEVPLPPPLAPPRLDLRVRKATARAYEVQAGEYVQVIDVAGRQCSDFLAFDAEALRQGLERGLDATTTRTLTGVAYPGPGLCSKFYDQGMRPLVEVIRDTVGRHDTFALACTAKYYEDQGYPGHDNCSDNFNAALAPYGVAPRAGWAAINFFYNTRVDDRNVLQLDEPWSRPGDYVLLRALTELVCASSACPDDIDPANGWNPTDIHVRVYPAHHAFSRGVAHRMTPDSEPQLTRATAFHPRTSALTRCFVDYRGYWLPASYTGLGAIAEYHACRSAAAVMDLSPLRKFEVLGPDAEALLQATVTRDVRKLAVGQVVYTALCHETGGMLDDGTVFRLGVNNFRLVVGDERDAPWLRQQAERLGLDRVWVKSSTEQLHNLAVQGPRSRAILEPLVWTPPTQPALAELRWFRFTIGRLGDPRGPAILVSRTGYTGELGYEVWCHPKDALAVWDAILEAGAPLGLTPLGLEALDILRIEAGLIVAGSEFDDLVDPFEAGIGFTVALGSKTEDFVGRAALVRRKQSPQRVLVGLKLEGHEPARQGDCVHVGRAQVGVITSGTRSPLLSSNLALGRLAVEHAAPGTEVEVGKLDGQQKRIPATVVRLPFYDPEKRRVRGLEDGGA
jgi:aminomethyltransferase